MGKLEQAVGQSTFAVVYMRNDAEIPYVLHGDGSF
jgi:hypothetical protein